jgi:hypothetical protein
MPRPISPVTLKVERRGDRLVLEADLDHTEGHPKLVFEAGSHHSDKYVQHPRTRTTG